MLVFYSNYYDVKAMRASRVQMICSKLFDDKSFGTASKWRHVRWTARGFDSMKQRSSKCLQKLKCSKTLASSKDDASVN